MTVICLPAVRNFTFSVNQSVLYNKLSEIIISFDISINVSVFLLESNLFLLFIRFNTFAIESIKGCCVTNTIKNKQLRLNSKTVWDYRRLKTLGGTAELTFGQWNQVQNTIYQQNTKYGVILSYSNSVDVELDAYSFSFINYL